MYYHSDNVLNPSLKTLKFFEIAKYYALRSNMTNKHGCIITKNGKIISYGYNHYQSKMKSFYIKGLDTNICALHAEMHALEKLYNSYTFKNKFFNKCNIYVVRISNTTKEYLNSKPCSNCIKILKYYNLSKTYYSSENNSFSVEKIKDLKSNHLSQGFKFLNNKS